jgi:hypothetical protein
MSLNPSSIRPTREGPLLVLALALVLSLCIPLYQTFAPSGDAESLRSTTGRLRHIFLGPEQVGCYCCFTWGAFILLSRYLEVRRQRKAFRLDLLPTEEGSRILPEDARPLQRKVDQQTRGKPYILANMIRLALAKYGITRSGSEVSETVRTQADVDMSRLVSSMATVHFLAWALPALGFLGTVRGLGQAMENPADAVRFLYAAFDATLVAIALSLPLMFFLHSVQRDEEGVVIDCQQYCLEHLVARLYDVEPEHAERGAGF